MPRTVLYFFAASLFAIAARAETPPVESHAASKLTFTETTVSAPVAPGAMTGWAWFGRRYSGYKTILYAGGDVTSDSDNDGLVTFTWTESATVPWNGIWVVTDLSTGEIMAGSRSTSEIPPSVTLPSNVFLRDQDGRFSHIVLPVSFLAYLQLERPGVGAWYAYLQESGIHDLDGTLNGRVVLNTKALLPVGNSPAAPDGVLAGDVFVGILFDPAAPAAPGFEEVWFGDAVENHLGDTPGTATISIANPLPQYTTEDAGTLRIAVLREENSDGAATVHYASSPANPQPGVHFDDFAGVLTFAPGEILKTIDVPIINDTLYSAVSEFTVTLSSPAGAALGTVTTAELEIRDTDDDAPSLTLATSGSSRLEGDSGSQDVPVTVTLSSPAATAITVNWSWQEGSGVANTGSMLFAPGETQKSFTMTYLANTTTEADRQLNYGASWHPFARPSVVAQGSFTIVDDDRPGVPQALEAHSDGGAVSVSWLPDPKATTYVLESASADTGWTTIYSGAATSFLHTSVAQGHAYLYRVRAVDANQVTSNWSVLEVATTITFADDQLAAGTQIKATHLEQLATAVNAVRALGSLPPLVFTHPVDPGSLVRASQILELREALAAARSAVGLLPVSFTDSSLIAGTTFFKAAHVTELRQGCR